MSVARKVRRVFDLRGVSVSQLYARVLSGIKAGKYSVYAAALAYYFLFAIFPLFIFVAALLAYLPLPNLLEQILTLLVSVMPEEALKLIRDNVTALVSQPRGGLLSFGILVALWTASNAITAIMDALNHAYEVEEARPYWKVRLIALLLTIGLSVFVIASIVLLIFGPQIGGHLANYVGLGAAFEDAWNVLRWPVIFLLLTTAAAIVYYFAPDVEQEWKWITPGSIFSVIMWTLASLGFSYYVNNFGSYDKTYGSIGAIIVLLTWMYVSGYAILVGGEINAEIEHASASGKEPGEKVEGAGTAPPGVESSEEKEKLEHGKAGRGRPGRSRKRAVRNRAGPGKDPGAIREQP